ncbi:MAG TPA: BMP family ABC transporter substrate-binding protein [Clostridiales bacterium]|nr:BMP family ABC transporter substrate-binding protein [Clostridiales bacterium]
MKRNMFVFGLAALTLVGAGLVSCGNDDVDGGKTKIAMITDYGDITDQSFNQTTWEGVVEWGKENNYETKYYKPADNSDAARIASAEKAIEEGYDVIVMPGYAFAATINKVAPDYKDTKFIALDVAKGDLLADYFGKEYDYNPDNEKWSSYTLPSNVYSAVYQEEIAGFFAGYAITKEGYTKSGFLGGMAVPAVIRYGYGFVQGVNAAAEDGKEYEMKYTYGGQFQGDADITARTDLWYQSGTEIVFACGGGIYTSACESAKKLEPIGKVVGVDTDQSAIIDTNYGAGMCVTSAMKGLKATVLSKLTEVVIDKKWESKIETLGLVSGTDVEKNYVQLPTDTWSMKNFTIDDYKALVKDVYEGKYKVSNNSSTETHPETKANVKVTYEANIK